MLASSASWTEIDEYLKTSEVPTAILPVGSVEAHGPHLPLTVDSIIAEAIAREVGKRVGALVLPTLHYGQLWSLRNFPGSVWLESDTLSRVIYEIGASLKRHGFKLLVVINGHIGNAGALKEGLRRLMDEGLHVMVFNPGLIREIAVKYIESKFWHKTYFHAEEIETSLMLYLRPESVRMERASADYPETPFDLDYTFIPWDKLTRRGVIGDPTKATKEKGKAIFEEAVRRITALVEKEIEKIRSTR